MVVKRVARIMTGLVIVAALAGCVTDEAEDGHADDGHSHDMLMAEGAGDWTLKLDDCLEGGFAALYAMGEDRTLVEPWILADVREEVGDPMRDGIGMPLTGPARANWHQGFRCASAELGGETKEDFQFGFIANLVEAPDWDTGGADIHFLVSGLGLQDSAIRDVVAGSTTADVSKAIAARVDDFIPYVPPAPRLVYTVYDDVAKGTYESWSFVEPYRDFEERTIRLWWTVPADGSQAHLGHAHGDAGEMDMDGGWNPVYWDLHSGGGMRWTTPQIHSLEVACHTGAGADHGPQGGACQPTLTLLHEHASIDITYGGVFPDVVLENVWVH